MMILTHNFFKFKFKTKNINKFNLNIQIFFFDPFNSSNDNKYMNLDWEEKSIIVGGFNTILEDSILNLVVLII